MRNTIFISMKRFGESQSKAMRAYAQNGQYRTIVESRESNLGKKLIKKEERATHEQPCCYMKTQRILFRSNQFGRCGN